MCDFFAFLIKNTRFFLLLFVFVFEKNCAGGGQQVNPAVTVSMWALGKCSYTEAFVRIAGQMGGGLVAFPLFQAISDHFNLTPFGGPEFSKESNIDAFLSEFCATFLLMWAIYIVSLFIFEYVSCFLYRSRK